MLLGSSFVVLIYFLYVFLWQSCWTEVLTVKYSKAESNVIQLKRMGITVLHGINVKSMERHSYLGRRLSDRIVFNFPHAGFQRKECDQLMIKFVHLNPFLCSYLFSRLLFGQSLSMVIFFYFS